MNVAKQAYQLSRDEINFVYPQISVNLEGQLAKILRSLIKFSNSNFRISC